MRTVLNRSGGVLPLLSFLALGILLPAFASTQYVLLGVTILVSMLVAMSFNILFGYAGLFSFGQAAFYGLGAYAVALLMAKAGFGFFPAMIAGLVIVTAGGALSGLLLVRLEPIAFIMLTFALSDLLGFASRHLTGLTAGDTGLAPILPPKLSLVVNPTRVYYVALAITAVVVAIAFVASRSSAGLIVQSSRDDEARSRTLGVNVTRWRVGVFAFAAGIAGLAGMLSVLSSQIVYPEVFDWQISATALIVTLLGGVGRFTGPMIGAVMLGLIDFYVGRLTTDIQLVDGMVFLLIVLLAPRGVVSLLSESVERWRGRGPSGGRRPMVRPGDVALTPDLPGQP